MILLFLLAFSPLYHDYYEAKKSLCSLASVYPNLAQIETLGFSHRESLAILGIKISDNPHLREDEPRVLFCGVHHGCEVIGCEICLYLADSLLTGYGRSALITRVVDSCEIWIVPIVNPDGHLINFFPPSPKDTLWRKNKRDNNNNGQFDIDYDGVDVNRQYPFLWTYGGSTDPTSKYYRGPYPLSEKEAQVMANLTTREKFVAAIDYHSDSNPPDGEKVYYNWRWDASGAYAPDYPSIRPIAESIANRIRKDDNSGPYSIGIGYATSGGFFRNWSYYAIGTFTFLIEVSRGYYPAGSLITSICQRNIAGALYLLQRTLGSGIQGLVFDSLTGRPLSARVRVLEADAGPDTIQPRYSDSLFGRFRRLLQPGTYNLEISSPGYTTKNLSVPVIAGRPTNMNIYLSPLPSLKDVGCTEIVAPTGAVDSGINITPACTVKNFGNNEQTYTVRLKIGNFYNDTARVINHLPQTKVYLTFSPWTVRAPRGSYLVSCSTELSGDMVVENDKREDSVAVRVLDVGVTKIVAPRGEIDSGMVVIPSCSVKNFGNKLLSSYTVRMKVGDFYNQAISVSNHNPEAKIYLTFPANLIWPRGSYLVSCSTELSGDMVLENDKREDSVAVRVLDVGVTRIVAPRGEIDSGVVVIPACTVYNYGNTLLPSYTVRMKIGDFYNQTVSVSNHNPEMKLYLTFAGWQANQRGSYLVSCSTELIGDMVLENDKREDSVAVQVLDVGVTRIVAPRGEIDSGMVVIPACTVYNYGNTLLTSYTVRMKIGDFYNQAISVSNHHPEAKIYLTFPANLIWPRGSYLVSCSTELSDDMVLGNDKKTEMVSVRVKDVGTVAIVAPIGQIDSVANVSPACTVYNFGSESASYTVRLKIGDFYNSNADIANHPPQTKVYVTFPTWYANHPRGSYLVSCSTELRGDMVPVNDNVIDSVKVRVLDVGCIGIRTPSGVIDSGPPINPEAVVRNFGSETATNFSVRMEIGRYQDTKMVASLSPGRETTVIFDPWIPQRGTFNTKCSTQLTNDLIRTNDRFIGSVRVRVIDVGTIAIVIPVAVDSGSPVTPACSVQNFGDTLASYTVRLKIGDFHNSNADVSNHLPGTKIYLTFPVWYSVQPRGRYPISCSTELISDKVLVNDKKTDTVSVRVRDVGTVAIVAPTGQVDSGVVLTPACTLYNFGSVSETYPVRFKIGAFYNDTAWVFNHAPGSAVYLTFSSWTANMPRGSYPSQCSTELINDINKTNDRQEEQVFIRILDIAAIDITAPGDSVKKDSIFTPKARARNYGNTTVTLPTYFAIIRGVDTCYKKTVNITISPDSIKEVSFRDTAFRLTAWYQMRFWTELSGDMHPANNLVRDSFKVYQPGQAIGDLEKLVMVNRPGLVLKSNPTRLLTTVYYSLPAKEVASLVIYNVLGEVVYSAKTDKGFFTIKRLPAGTYLLRFTAKGYKEERKLIIVK